MSKRKRYKTEKERLYYENIGLIQDFELPPNTSKRFFRVFHEMLSNENFMKLSPSAIVVYLYMRDWASGSDEYLHHKTFDFSTTLLTSQGKFSRNTVMNAFKELVKYGFIKKVNNATTQSGICQKWTFLNKWYKKTEDHF